MVYLRNLLRVRKYGSMLDHGSDVAWASNLAVLRSNLVIGSVTLSAPGGRHVFTMARRIRDLDKSITSFAKVGLLQLQND